MDSSLKLSKIIIKNFGSYETETSIDLSASPLLICGDTGVGKSSIIEAIFACLTGGDIKEGVSLTEMISDFPNDGNGDRNKRELKAILFFENNGVQYKSEISKTIKSSQKIILSVFENNAYIPKFTQQEAKKELNRIVGVSAKALLATNILKQNQGSFFNKLGKSAKKDMIFEFFSLAIFEQIQEKTNKELREKEKDLDILMRNNYHDTEELNFLKMNAFTRKNRIETLDEELKVLQDKRYELENEKKVFEEIIRKKNKVTELHTRLKSYTDENEELKIKTTLTSDIVSLEKEVLTIEIDLSKLQENELKQIKHKSSLDNKKREIEIIKENLNKSILKYNEEIKILELSIPNFIKKSEEELGIWTEEKTNETINSLKQKCDVINGEISTLNKDIAVLESSKQILPKELSEMDKELNFLKKKDITTDERYISKKEEIFGFDVEMKRLQSAIHSLSHICEGECPTCYQNITEDSKDITRVVLNEKLNEITQKKDNGTSELSKLQIIIEKDLKREIMISDEQYLTAKRNYEENIDNNIKIKNEEINKLNNVKLENNKTIEKLNNGLVKYFTELKIYERIQKIKEHISNDKLQEEKDIKQINDDILLLNKENIDFSIDYSREITIKKELLLEKRKELDIVKQSEEAKKTIEKNKILINDIEIELKEIAGLKDVKDSATILELDVDLKDLSKKISELELELFNLRKDTDRLIYLENKMVDYIKKSDDLKDDIDVLTEMMTLYSRDGIPTELIKEIASDVENEGNKYLSKFSGGHYSMKFVFEEEKSSGKGMKTEFDIKIYHENVVRKYDQLSGGEQTWLDWSQHIAFAKVLYKKFNKPFIDLLIIDEGFGTQGNNTLPKVVNALFVLQQEFSNILIISHHPALQEVFTNRIEIKKNETSGRSFID